MKHTTHSIIQPHKHTKRLTSILRTTEVILLLTGTLRVDFYNDKYKYLFSKKINERDIIMLIHGGHGFKVLKNAEMIEVKQGPYSLASDKIKFKTVDEKKIKFK